MLSSKAVDSFLERIKKRIDETSDFIHINTDSKPLPLVEMAIDKLYSLKEMEFNIKKLM